MLSTRLQSSEKRENFWRITRGVTNSDPTWGVNVYSLELPTAAASDAWTEMASNLIAMASNLTTMADGLQPSSDGLNVVVPFLFQTLELFKI